MRPRFSWPITLLLCACGPNESGDTGTASSDTSASMSTDTASGSTGPIEPTGSSGSTDSPADTGDGSGTSGGETPTTGATPTTGDVLCEDPTVPVGPAVEVQIHNLSGERVFVDHELGCKPLQPFTIAAGPNVPALKLDLGSFEFACSEAQGSECGRDPGCPVGGRVIQIEPDGKLTLPWSGGTFVQAELPEGCAEQFCGGCWIEQQAADSVYTVGVGFGKMIVGCDGPCTNCEPNDEGWCVTDGVRLEQGNAGKPFTYPKTLSVVVEIP